MTPEFSHPVALDRIEEEPSEIRLTPDAGERAAIARRLDLLALTSLTATVRVWFLPGRRTLALEGSIDADLEQACVVTLKPVPARIADRFAEIQGAPLGEAEAMALFPNHPDFDPEEAEDPEPLENGTVDLGEIVVQYLSLALDPYPRVAGPGSAAGETASDGVEINGPERDPETSPFAKLAALKRGGGGH